MLVLGHFKEKESIFYGILPSLLTIPPHILVLENVHSMVLEASTDKVVLGSPPQTSADLVVFTD